MGAANYAGTPTRGAATLTLADASRTAPANQGVIFTPGAAGGRVERISWCPLATTPQTTLRIFVHDGAAFHLLFEQQINAQTLAGTVASVGGSLQAVDDPDRFPIQLPIGYTLRASINDAIATGLKVQAEGGSF